MSPRTPPETAKQGGFYGKTLVGSMRCPDGTVVEVQGTYDEYLRSPYWRQLRQRILARAKGRCERCRAVRDLQVHHLTYVRLGCELETDLEAACARCHEASHGVAVGAFASDRRPIHVRELVHELPVAGEQR